MAKFGHEIPAELVQQIIGYLEDDEESLRLVSLVSSKFKDHCQRIIFSKVQFQHPWNAPIGPRYSPGKRLLSLLQKSPEIGTYFRDLTIDGGCTDDVEESWVAQDLDFSAALKLIPPTSIRRLRISNVWWDDLPGPAKESISTIARSTSLHTLVICECPVDLLSVCGPSLKHLETYSLTNFRPSGRKPAMVERDSSFGLETLTLLSSQYGPPRIEMDYLLNDANRTGISNLKRLRLMFSNMLHYPAVMPLLEKATSLTSLLVFQSSKPDCKPTLDLAVLPSLQMLSMRGHVMEDHHPITALLKLLRTASPSTPLTYIHTYTCCNSRPLYVDPWKPLDEFLADNHKGQLPKLSRLHIRLFSYKGDRKAIMDRLEGALPYSKQAGILEISIDTEVKQYSNYEPF
ncbi:hypothetical protein FA15DRAFT_675346 [Coprinopsis marcescibilis]|uniref:F-box domain-containing protein n=1 Tax=Coprinopsis marcescibilis TaxID=230819 RepID=A0A5C3KEQ7_COPMA|nr:hypothetical protein FA15DRAFT_675346 [Coprinopsis marcescibilis]